MATQIDVHVVASSSITFLLSTTSLALRMVARRMTSVPLWWDDYLILCAYAFAIAYYSLALNWSINGGLGQLVEDSPLSVEDTNETARFSLFLVELFYAFSLYFSKASILSFYWRLFSTSNIRLPIQILQGAALIWITIRLFMGVFHCIPVQAFWDHSITGAVCNINDGKFMFGTTFVHLVMDCVILALPAVQVKNLQLRLGQKMAVVGLFMFGIFVCIASIVVLITAFKLDPHTTELPRDITPIIIWAGIEVQFAIVSACLPMMRPVFRKLMPGSMLGSNPTQPISGLTGSKGIKLTNVTRSKEVDDDSSQRRFAGMDDGSSDSLEYNGQYNTTQPKSKTVITSSGREQSANPRTADGEPGSLHVRNEVTVHYESA